MKIESGSTTRYIYFVAVDATDLKTRETGLSSFTVYRSRNGGASAAMTTPTINETDATNMPGVYELLVDEDTTIAAGNDTEEMAFHITASGMAPVTRIIELFRPKITSGNTLAVASDGDLLEVNTLTGHTAQTGDSYSVLAADILAETRDKNLLAQLQKITAVVEHQRGSHTYQPIGNMFFVDPVNGDTHANGNRGGISDPYSLVQDCHDNAVTDSNHDMIILLSGASAGATTLTEAVTISKRYLFIRGPGRDFIWTRSGSGDTITITADGIELSGFQLNTATTGNGSGIQLTDADFLRAHRLWINDTRGDGINIVRGSNCQIIDNVFTSTGSGGAGDGIQILGTGGSSNGNNIDNNRFISAQGDAIAISGGTTNTTHIVRNHIENSSGWGINLGASAADTHICDNRLGNNGSGAINDLGTATVPINNEQYSTSDEVAILPTAIENADTLLNRDMSIVSDTNSRTPLNALRKLRNKWFLSGLTWTITKEDDTTTAYTETVTTDPLSNPVTGTDPN